MLDTLHVETVEVRLPRDLSGCDGLILPGGESTAISMLLESSGLRAPLGDALNAGLPVFGTCAGMILLSSHISDGRKDQWSYRALDISVRRNGFGRQVRSFEGDIDVVGLDRPVRAVFIRAPVIDKVGSDVEILGSVEYRFADGATTVVPAVVRSGNVVASSFHPELTDDPRLHELFLKLVAER